MRLALCCSARSVLGRLVMRSNEGNLKEKEGSGWKPCVAIRPTLLKRLPQRVKVSQGCDWRVESEVKVAQTTDLSRQRRAPQGVLTRVDTVRAIVCMMRTGPAFLPPEAAECLV